MDCASYVKEEFRSGNLMPYGGGEHPEKLS